MQFKELEMRTNFEARFIAKTVIVGAVMISLAGCAETSSAVEPVSMGNAFESLSCNQVVPMLNEERQRVAALSQQQNNAAAGDAIGVFLIAVPVSSLTGGDVSGDLAAAKGRSIALENRARTCGYSVQYVSPQTTNAASQSSGGENCQTKDVYNHATRRYDTRTVCD